MIIDKNKYIFNEFQSSLDDLEFDKQPEEVQEEFIEYIESVPFIKNLISPTRPWIQDLPKDKDGKAIIDLTNPPLYSGSDVFRPTALVYEKTGKLTTLRPNKNPNSDYHKWVERDVKRSWNGMTAPNGMYIPGLMYWFLNYSPIELVQSDKKGKKHRVFALPEFWEGIWWRLLGWEMARDLGQNFSEIAARRKSKSFTAASRMSRDFCIGESESARTSIRDVAVATTKEYLTKDGTLNKFEKMIDFVTQQTGWATKRLRNVLSDMEWVMGYEDTITGTKMGSLNQVLGVSIKDDPDKVRGKASAFIFAEEFGNFPHFSRTYDIMQPSVRQGNDVFGQICAAGTGGSEGGDFQGAMEMIYHPKGYNVYEFDNVWDKSMQGKGKSIFFFPAYVNYGGCYNKDGISDVTKALMTLCKQRFVAKYDTTDILKLTRTKAEYPITIQDAIMRIDGTLFPVAQLNERILEIESNPNFYDDVYVGEMIQKSNGEVEFQPSNKQAIRKFPHKDNKIEGAIEIFKMPEKNKEGKVFSNRYIASLDPVDDDTSETMSLQSAFIMDLWTDTIVCEYTGRTTYAEDYFEQFRLLLLFYNARCNYENNKKGIFAYFQKMNSLYLLTDTLEFLKDKDMVKLSYGNKAKGTSATAPINNYARQLIRNWLIKPITRIVKEDDQEKQIEIANLHQIRNIALLQELSQWNIDGNFDRVSSLGMLMLLREDKLITFGGHPETERDKQVKSISKDDYFTKNYEKYKQRIGKKDSVNLEKKWDWIL